MARRPVQERIDEQVALIDKAQKRNDEIALSRAQRVQQIAEHAGVFDTNHPEKLMEQAIKNAVAEKRKTNKNQNDKTNDSATPVDKKTARENRVFRQNVARIERANRTIRRLKLEARRIDASQKWRLGFLLQLAKLESMDINVLDKTCQNIIEKLNDADTCARWKKTGSHRLDEQKNDSQNNENRTFDTDKADSHRKITLGGLVKKHKLDALSPALLLGALIELNR